MSTNTLILTVSVVTFNTPHSLLEALIASLKASEIPLTITLVDNTPDTAYFKSLEAFSDLQKIHSPVNGGYGAGHNMALKATPFAPYHLIVNPDVVIQSGCLKTLLGTMEAHPDIGLLIPKVLFPDGSLQPLNRRDPTIIDLILRRFLPRSIQNIPVVRKRMDYYVMRDHGYETSYEVPNATGCFMFFRRSVLDTVGGFDEQFFMNFEDCDLSRRTRKIARVVYCPNAVIIHHWAREAHTKFKLTIITLVSAWKYFRKWGFLWY